jgi:Uma2 family endonuclease
MNSTIPAPRTPTLADVIRRLGGIDPERILARPAPGTATLADVRRFRRDEGLIELIDGTLVRKMMGFRESLLASYLIALLYPFVRQANLGVVTAPDGLLELAPNRVRIPDVAFLSWARLGGQIPNEPIPAVVPDLAIEILSESNTPAEMRLKRENYFTAGVRVVWEIDPVQRSARIYSGVDAFVPLAEGDCLDGGAVLPGFSLPLAHLFAEIDRLPDAEMHQ